MFGAEDAKNRTVNSWRYETEAETVQRLEF